MKDEQKNVEMTKKEVKEVKEEAKEEFQDWIPKTNLGKLAKERKINIDEIIDKGIKILEPEIVEILLPNLEQDLLSIGQSKGKFGGGKRSIWKQTQKKTKEGNKPKFATLAIVGNYKGYIGVGHGKSKETVPARTQAVRKAKLNVIKIRLGCGSWACGCKENHTIPLKVTGKCGSVRIDLIPAPKGTGLCVEKELKKILNLAGIKDVYSKTYGKTKTKLNLIYACFDALKNLGRTRMK